MKKALVIILTIAFGLLLCACAGKKYKVLVSGIAEGGVYSADASVEYELQNEFKQIGDVDRVYEAVINGETYSGKYVETLISPYYRCDADIYLSTDDSGREVEFRINRASNELTGYSFAYRNGYAIRSDDRSYEDCYQIALEELARRLNVDEYEPTMHEEHQKVAHVPECGNIYSFYFVRMMNGMKSNVIVWINVNTDGIVCLFSAVEAPSLDDPEDCIAFIEAMDDAEIRESIDKKIASIYDSYDHDKLHWTVDKQLVSKLRSGKPCIQYLIDISIEGYDEPEHLSLLVLP